ncbi:acetylcholinesterase-like [Penaeus japonicus]|uniref:acetylcholinesterase-like n=1 Tax=Penaeus japonicus TaxID=27405 RepID=UPI001C717394|nr:acetylcholinesterase-like [Penaeus japonicus]
MQVVRFGTLAVVLAAAALVSGAKTPLQQQTGVLVAGLKDRVPPGTPGGNLSAEDRTNRDTDSNSLAEADATPSSSTTSTSPPTTPSATPSPSTFPTPTSGAPATASSTSATPSASSTSAAPTPPPPTSPPTSQAPTPSPTPSPPPFPEVTVEGLGTARGKVMTSYLGRPFYAFMSLPYAMPPEGSRRFKNPDPWTGEWEATLDGSYDATYLRARCPQISLILDVTAGREDCLHLSIYTPRVVRFGTLAVVLAAAALVSGAKTPLQQQTGVLVAGLKDRVPPRTPGGNLSAEDRSNRETDSHSLAEADTTPSSSTTSTSPPTTPSATPSPSTFPTPTSGAPATASSTSATPSASSTSAAPTPPPPTSPPTSQAPTPSPTPSPPPFPEVTVEGLGTARGKVMTSYQIDDLYAFMSLPYAMPPEGSRRFKNPDPWTGEWEATLDGSYDATYLRARCPQISLILDVTAGREDCLHLSIYTPRMPGRPGTQELPVMVWIHGGAYMTGDANLYVPTKLMDRDVVVVVVQYRLGSLGFLAGGIPDAPGNMGLMDQITALRWVQDYISYFGGDRDTVTVFGQSAGGASTSWMQITPLTNGNWDKREGKRKRLTPSAHQPARRPFLQADDRMKGGLGFKGLCPVVQDTLAAENHLDLELVIPKSPVDIVEAQEFLRVPVMTGSVRDEGSLVVGLAYKDYLYPNEHFPNDTEFARDHMVGTLINAFGIEDRTGSVTNAMTLTFLPNAEMGNWYSMVGGLVDMGGMLFLKSGLWNLMHSINKVDESLPIFFYSWEFESDDSLFPWIFISMPDIPVPGGIGHADELLYLFHLPSVLDERQKTMSQRMLTLWTNFAKYGNPTPVEFENDIEDWTKFTSEWKTFSITEPNFMLLRDNITNELDFTTRWNYHIDAGITTTPGPSTSEGPDPVSRLDYDEQVKLTEQFKIATGILGGLCGCTLFLSAVFFVRMRRLKTV